MTVVDIIMPAQCVVRTPECAANCLLSAISVEPQFCPELTNTSFHFLINLNAQFQYDKVGSTARRSLQLGFERKF